MTGGAVRVYLVRRYDTEYDDGQAEVPDYRRAYRRRSDAQADCDSRNARDSEDVWEVDERVGIPFEGEEDRIVVLDKMAPGGSCMDVRLGVEGKIGTRRAASVCDWPF